MCVFLPGLYPNLQELGDYMGLSLNSDEVQKNLALVPVADSQVAVPSSTGLGGMVRPVTGNDVGLRRAEIRPGLREIILCKDESGKVGLRLRAIDNGIFIQLVQTNSPAALVGLRFGDQVLQINGQNCAGWTLDKAHKALKVAAEHRIELIVRDRPFQRTITMHKDSTGHVGFIFKSGLITSLVKDGSAARNGLLTDHYICEINGQNVIGLKVRSHYFPLTCRGAVNELAAEDSLPLTPRQRCLVDSCGQPWTTPCLRCELLKEEWPSRHQGGLNSHGLYYFGNSVTENSQSP
ncbi:hypothetical protein Z043_109850 [Scleropages formosus]|uniref:PDZ domain-containing protein n=1 Tax=Scleropages formosus TaxID=113540 RepID=A0A0P7UB20_SCLFO|nr:hypothetical protein Z043_109850 [Scleropages formosus]